MKYPLYSYRDVMIGFMMPQADTNDETAKRGFTYAINNHEGLMNFSPKDFDLYCVGEFDTDTGEIKSCLPRLVLSGVNAIGVKYES